MEQLLAGRSALITGGGVGIGRAIALRFASAGARVAVTYRTHEPDREFLAELANAAGDKPISVAVDATSEQRVIDAISLVDQQLQGLDILVNNVGGLVGRATLSQLTLERWREILRVNLDSTFLFTHHALPIIRRGSGRIINLASLAGHTGGHPGALAYATSKAALFGFTRALANELAPRALR
nr:SDR family NAD(P)-dependent oxidoreductase [Mycobacteroides salmoniphilum]